MNPKILKKPYFYSAKMAPQKVDKLITLKVAKLITLWRPKGGQTNNSPAYIYIYIYIYIYAAGCLKEPQILTTPFARNMRKRSAKCFFF